MKARQVKLSTTLCSFPEGDPVEWLALDQMLGIDKSFLVGDVF